MSGHSHWKSIKRVKESEDKKRGQIFSKISRSISVAARENGPNPETNPKLRLAIEEARSFNMPKENIERAIQRGTGELREAALEEVLFEAYGPGGIALIIEGITDNKNRALSEIKQILASHGGKLADTGSVKWMFERKGVITAAMTNDQAPMTKEDLELKAIETGAEDFSWHNDILKVYTEIGALENVKKNLENQGIKIESVSLDWVAKENAQNGEKEKEATQKLFEALDESEVVQEIYSNLKT